MTVLRVEHQRNYVVINKLVLENPNLSFKAKGLWAYCMSRPDEWQFHVSHLATVSKDGEDAIYSAIKELEKEGFIRKTQSNEGGKFGKVDYIVSEIQIILPQPDFPDAGNPRAENPALTSIDSQQVMKKQERGKSLSPFSFGLIKMSGEEYESLQKMYNKSLIDDIVKKMDLYLKAKDRTYKNYFLEVQRWLERDWNQAALSVDEFSLKEFMECAAENLKKEVDCGEIVLGNDYIEFLRGINSDIVKIGSLHWDRKIISNLNAMNKNCQWVYDFTKPEKPKTDEEIDDAFAAFNPR